MLHETKQKKKNTGNGYISYKCMKFINCNAIHQMRNFSTDISIASEFECSVDIGIYIFR